MDAEEPVAAAVTHPRPTEPPPPEPRPAGRFRGRTRPVIAGGLAAAAVLATGLGVGIAATVGEPGSGAAAETRSGSAATHDSDELAPDPWTGSSVPDLRRLPRQSLPGTATGGLDASEATAGQEAGMVLVSSPVSFGAGEAVGTGMVLTGDGEVVTNHHVVEGATDIEVTVVATGETYEAKVLGTDAAHDVALLSLAGAKGLETVDTDTTGVAVGDQVTAVGDANGDGGSLTAADGTVTALAQPVSIETADGTTRDLTGLIQIDADVVSGDSGGAVLDSDGEVVGMTTAASRGGADITGYAVPIGRALRIVDTIRAGEETGSVEIGYDGFLGIRIRGARSYGGAAGDGGTTVAEVIDGTAAARLGLEAGDTINAIGGVEVATPEELQQAISGHDAGDKVTVTWTGSDGTEHSGAVVLTEAPVG